MFCLLRICKIDLLWFVIIEWSRISGRVVIRFSVVVISVREMLLVMIFGLFVLNNVIVWNVRIILIIVFSRFSNGVIVVKILMMLILVLMWGVLCRIVLLSLSLRFLMFWFLLLV